mmetsp:Transcript_26065/g.36528  ORF Transcript_26065/g.36528 Transcript_26065/m.36528 type:complete len:85 (+) Transcript_26065:217-471(+)
MQTWVAVTPSHVQLRPLCAGKSITLIRQNMMIMTMRGPREILLRFVFGFPVIQKDNHVGEKHDMQMDGRMNECDDALFSVFEAG